MNKFFLITCFCLLSFSLSAQYDGIKIGTNINWHTRSLIDIDKTFDPGLGFQIGYVHNFSLTQNLKLNSELIFAKQAFSYEYTNVSDYFTVPFIIDNKYATYGYYLNLPVGFSYMCFSKIYINVGYQIGRSLSSQIGNKIGAKWNSSIYSGLGYHAKFGDINFRYIHNLNDDGLVYGIGDGVLEDSGRNRILEMSLVVPIFNK